MKIVKQNIEETFLPSHIADLLGLQYTSSVSKEHKKQEGQFFTPRNVAMFMGEIASPPNSKIISILDPGCGTGILSCSLIEYLVEFEIESIELVLYETDNNLLPVTEKVLQNLKSWLRNKNIELNYILKSHDFIEDILNDLNSNNILFDYVISNPPYFKLSKGDKRVKLLQKLFKGQSNIYSAFMAVSANLLKSNGELIFIVPRSFTSGQYFNSFRDYFFKHIHLNFVHLFKSRSKTFDRDNVLQEILILKGSKVFSDRIIISTSEGTRDLENRSERNYEIENVLDLSSIAKIFHLPTTVYEDRVMSIFKSWNKRLIDFNIQISTGPIVSFRSKEYLYAVYENSSVFLTSLFWLQNVTKMNVEWPLFNSNKNQYISVTDISKKSMVPNKNYVFLRRFSSKDDTSRLIAAPYFKETNNVEVIGIENKLNYIYSLDGELQESEIVGIAALLNSELFDTYFRTFNGNINVSATEIRLLSFPAIETIRELGNQLIAINDYSELAINRIINIWVEENIEFVHE